jgi:hypothetical protein
MALDTNVFMQLMAAVHDGLQTSDATLCSLCANTIDHLATFYFTFNGKDKPEVHNLNKVRHVWLSMILDAVASFLTLGFPRIVNLSILRHSRTFSRV